MEVKNKAQLDSNWQLIDQRSFNFLLHPEGLDSFSWSKSLSFLRSIFLLSSR